MGERYESVDAATLSDGELRQAFIRNGTRWGSDPDWTLEQIEKALADRAGIRVYRNDAGEVEAYYKEPEHRS